MESFAERLRKIESILDLSPGKMAEIGGCSRSTYYRYRSGRSIPDMQFVRKILNYETALNPEWLINGNGRVDRNPESDIIDPFERQSETGTTEANDENIKLIYLPFHRMKADSRGEGGLNRNEWDRYPMVFPISRRALGEMIRVDRPDHLHMVRVECDSMSPDIPPSSLILVDSEQTGLRLDALCLVSFDNIIRMKLIQKLPGQKVRFATINRKYTPFELSEEECSQVEVIGRIIWYGTAT